MYAMVVAAVLMLAVAEEGGGEGGPNCRGCFNETSGVCVLDNLPAGHADRLRCDRAAVP